MSTIAASDLDRTLIYSRAAFQTPTGGEEPDLVCVELYRGEPMSFVTAAGHRLLEQLAFTGALVPVTSRTVQQYQRITLPGPTPAFAICANGGRLLVSGVEDVDYRNALVADLAVSSAPLEQVWQILQRAADRRARRGTELKSIRTADDLFCYAVEFERADPGWVAELADAVAPLGWGVTRQLRKVYVVPDALTKVRALDVVRRRIGATRVVAAGDSHLDVSILAAADAAIRPAHGELHEEGWQTTNLSVTAASGIAAGEQIASWLLHHLAPVNSHC